MIVSLALLVWFALLLFSLLDIDRTPDGAARGLPQSGWFLVVVLVPILGALAWLLAGRPRSPGRARERDVTGAVPPDGDVPWLERSPVEQRVEDEQLQQILDRIDREFEEAVHPTGNGAADAGRET
jgi:hypothetical protein